MALQIDALQKLHARYSGTPMVPHVEPLVIVVIAFRKITKIMIFVIVLIKIMNMKSIDPFLDLIDLMSCFDRFPLFVEIVHN